MFRLLKRLKAAEWLQALVSLVFIVTQVWLDLKLPDYMSEITRLTQTPGSEMSDIWMQGAYMLACALGSFASAVIVGYFASRIAASHARRLRGMRTRPTSGERMNHAPPRTRMTMISSRPTTVPTCVVT